MTARTTSRSPVNQKKPTVPGPACAPITAPSDVSISICACGRMSRTIFSSSTIRSGASACAMPTRSAGFVARVRLERVDELLECLAVAADALHRQHLAVADREDRLHVQQLPGERLRLADAAAAREELERVDGEEQAVLDEVPLDERVDLLVGRAALEPALDREREHRDRRPTPTASRSCARGRRRAAAPPCPRSGTSPRDSTRCGCERMRSYAPSSS